MRGKIQISIRQVTYCQNVYLQGGCLSGKDFAMGGGVFWALGTCEKKKKL